MTTAHNESMKRDLRKPVRSLAVYGKASANRRLQTIFSDAILAILDSPAEKVNGLLTLDEDFLRQHRGVTDFSKYSVVAGAKPRRIMPQELPSLEVAEQDDEGTRMDSVDMRKAKL